MQLLNTIVAFLFALGILIFFHELGHYLVARLCGVKVLRFSIGFGRPIAAWRAGPDRTEWAVGAFPLGGYVKMLDEREGPVETQELPRAFNRQTVGKRIAIVAAGPLANFLLAIVLYWVLFVAGMPGLKPIIAAPEPGSLAAAAGFRGEETILSVDGEPVASWQDFRWLMLDRAVKRERVELETRDAQGGTRQRTLDLSATEPQDLDKDFLRALGLTLYRPAIAPVVGRVVSGGAADRAGLQAGDEILTADGKAVDSWQALVEVVRASPEHTLALEVRRAATRLSISVTPARVEEGGRAVGRIGAEARLDERHLQRVSTTVRYPPGEAIGKAVAKTWEMSVFSLKMLGKMVIGQLSWKNLSGPLTIADYAGQSAQLGWVAYVAFIALISVSLGVLNLLPIPLLDGGHLMYYAAEVFKGSPVSERAMEIGSQIGLALLIGLMAFAFYNDINRLLGS